MDATLRSEGYWPYLYIAISLLEPATGLRFLEADSAGNADLLIVSDTPSPSERDYCGTGGFYGSGATVTRGRVRIFPYAHGCAEDVASYGAHLLAHEILHATLGMAHTHRKASLMSYHRSSNFAVLSPMDEALLRLNAELPAGTTQEQARSRVVLTDGQVLPTSVQQEFVLLAANARFRRAGAQFTDCNHSVADLGGYGDLQAWMPRVDVPSIQRSNLGAGLFQIRGTLRSTPTGQYGRADILEWRIDYTAQPLSISRWEMLWTLDWQHPCKKLRVWG